MAWWFFQNAVVTAILACGVLVMCRFVRIGPVARHALWVLVLVKFVTPPIVRVAVGGARSARPGAGRSRLVSRQPGVAAAPLVVDDDKAHRDRHGHHGTTGRAWEWIPRICFAGRLGVGDWSPRAARAGRHPRGGARTACAQRTRGRSGDCHACGRVGELLDLKPIPVVLVAGHASPMVWCFGRTRLLWPEDLDADAHRRLHRRTHRP